jgi:DNA-directed RNA polymerase subunit beta
MRRYDLSRVGRYKYNKKLAIGERIANKKISRPIADPVTGEILAEAGEILESDKAYDIERGGSISFMCRESTGKSRCFPRHGGL